MEDGYVQRLTRYFVVPKGDDNIRVVYYASHCGLNDKLWAPDFILPTIDSVLRSVDSGCWFGDANVGEMFLNYMLNY